jgi:hypothetical protein
MPKKVRIPSYRFHKGSGQAVVVLRGQSVYAANEGPSVQEQGPNRLRVRFLTRIIELLSAAAAQLERRLQTKLNPPSVRDRVHVDCKKGRVTVDGRVFSVSANPAVALHSLAEGNGGPVSGPSIASKEGIEEFKLGRYVREIKKKYLILGGSSRRKKRT